MEFIYPDSLRCIGNAISKPILAVGRIEPSSLIKFADYIKANGPYGVVEFHSMGGDLNSALALGKLIRENSMGTSIGRVCASACAYAFLGGTRRYGIPKKYGDGDFDYDGREPGAVADKFGVHQFYEENALKDPGKISFTGADRAIDQNFFAKLIDYVIKMGVDPRLVIIAAQVKPWDPIRWLSREELQDLRVDNMTRQYSNLNIKPFGKAGTYAEITNSKADTKSQIRIFCDRKVKGVHFALVFYEDGAAGLAETVNKTSIELLNKRTKQGFSYHFVLDKPVTMNTDGQVVSLVPLRVPNMAYSDIVDAEYIRFNDGGEMSRSEWLLLDLLKFKIQGDPRYLRIAMSNCIN